MRNFSTICLSLLMAASTQVLAAGKTADGQKFHKPLPTYPVTVPGMIDNSTATQQFKEAGLFSGIKYAPERVTDDPATQVADSYGWVMGPDGFYWHYTMDLASELVRDTGFFKEYKYKGADVKVYDNNNLLVGSFKIDVPDSIFCNRIQLYGPITKKLFDNNDKNYEIMCDIHHAKNGDSYSVTRAYSIESGELLFDKKGSGIIFDASPNSYTIFQRLILVNEDQKADGKEYTDVEMYKNPGWGEKTAVLEKTFHFDQSLNYYMQGSYLNFYKINDEPYFVLAQYEKPWEMDRDPEDYNNVVQCPDNHLILKTYGMAVPKGGYYKEWTLVDSIAIDGNCPDGYGHRTLGFGSLGFNDISKGYFTGDNKFNYVIAAYDYVTSKDADEITFSVYNSDGKHVKDIIKNASSEWWRTLSSVPGKEDQIAFLQTIGDGDAATDQITLIDVPSCKQATILPYQIEGNKISTTLDRKPSHKNNYGYQYVVSLAQGESDEEENVIAPIAWINPNGTIDHKDAMNLGKNGEYFTPLLNDVTLNPYVFDTDDEMEYIYLAKKRRTDGSNKIDNVLEIAKADGTVLKSFESNDDKRIVEPAVIPVNSDGKYELALVYANNNSEKYEISFYDLPVNKFAEGGDGTKENPYLISSAGDLMQMGHSKQAYYKLANDIEMTEAGLWQPIDEFQGELDGDGHSIFNLYVNTEAARAGLFGNLSYGGHVKNVNFVNPTIKLTSNNGFAGIVAGSCSTDASDGTTKGNACENIHVMNGNIYGQSGAVIGGIIGQATLYGHVYGSSFQGTINAPRATEGVGGIVGATFTGSTIAACSSNLIATASENLGGILGQMSANCGDVMNCESQGTLTAGNSVGGIVGVSNRTYVSNCIARTDIYANNPSKFAKYAAGGIVGLLEANPYYNADSFVAGSGNCINNSVMTGSIYVNGVKFDGTSAKENRVHMIVGSSTDDEPYQVNTKYDEDADDWIETIVSYAQENGLNHNYTTTQLATTTEATSSEGKYVASKDLNKSFFQNADNFTSDYAYGSEVKAPWKGEQVPVLYFDNEAKSITISHEDVILGLNDPWGSLQVVVYGVDDAEDIDVVSDKPGIVEASIESIEGNVVTINIKALKQGVANINVTYGDFSTSCMITVLQQAVNGIDNVEVGNFKVNVSNGLISAENAKAIQVYSVGGQLVAKSNGTAISTTTFNKGIYVVKATDNAGHKSTAKFVVK